jgi:hypothetical protein
MNANSARTNEPVRDEWGIFDPKRAGVPAVIDALRDPGAADLPVGEPSPAAAPQASPNQNMGGALYTLETAVHCPHCDNEIRMLRVLRVIRTQASFTSTLPRKGYVVVCPECDRMLSAELSGLL